MAFQLSWYHVADQAGPLRGFRQIAVSDSITVGREDGADVVLKDRSVSRLHAEIYVDGRGVHVVDKGSANGIKIDARKVKEAIWLPGQKMAIGHFVLELAPSPAQGLPNFDAPVSRPAVIYTRMAEPAPKGRIELGDVFLRARQNDKRAVTELFSGFLGRTEQVVDCGYLGALGFVFPEYSFWCVTNSRVCGLLINRGGWMNFNFGFLKTLNRAVFIQPSIVTLWVAIILWLVFAFCVALSVFGWVYYSVFVLSASTFLASVLGLVMFVLVIGCGVVLIPWVVRAYYRWIKAGCVFWTRELVPIVIPSDRYSLRDAQRFISVFTDQKHMVGE